MKDFLGILGGLGPESSAYFYKMIISKTKVNNDQDHIDMVIINHATIPDRTEYIMDNSKDSPLDYLVNDVKTLNNLGASLIAIPCNTSFYFYEKMKEQSKVKILNMIEDTILYLKQNNIKKVFIFATQGTIASELYQKECDKNNIEYFVPDSQMQNDLMSLIYDNVKTGQKIDVKRFNSIVRSAKRKKIDAIILGCTELSIIKDKLKLSNFFVDPLEIEAEIIIKFYKKQINS